MFDDKYRLDDFSSELDYCNTEKYHNCHKYFSGTCHEPHNDYNGVSEAGRQPVKNLKD